MITVYILFSETLNKFYTGQTEDFERRLTEHNRGKTAFLAKGVPWKLVWRFEVVSRSEALVLEKQIKARGAKRFLFDQGIIAG